MNIQCLSIESKKISTAQERYEGADEKWKNKESHETLFRKVKKGELK
ncbi:MAG: hypothetical protein GYA87_03245 [Christensenellaceae bacterium]|nr:hypothetical protein [Christensenellaceae bacterium]